MSCEPYGIRKLNFDIHKKEITNALENIKNSLIDRMLITRNKQLLVALKSILERISQKNNLSFN